MIEKKKSKHRYPQQTIQIPEKLCTNWNYKYELNCLVCCGFCTYGIHNLQSLFLIGCIIYNMKKRGWRYFHYSFSATKHIRDILRAPCTHEHDPRNRLLPPTQVYRSHVGGGLDISNYLYGRETRRLLRRVPNPYRSVNSAQTTHGG